MSYSSNIAVSPSALRDVIEYFATTNGWSLGTGSWLSKGGSSVQLTHNNSTYFVSITGANTASGGTPSNLTKLINIASSSWPVTYYLFALTSPDVIVCAIQYDTDKFQWIIFGDLVKIHASAYTGGNFYHASKAIVTTSTPSLDYLSDTAILAGTNIAASPGLFIPSSSASQANRTPMYCDIDGFGWGSSSSTNFTLSDETISKIFRSPNTWNKQANLVHIAVQFNASSNLKMDLGFVEHIRYIRIDNYNIGDIITLGADKWKVFPLHKKDSVNRNAGYYYNLPAETYITTGTLGYAIRYDGP